MSTDDTSAGMVQSMKDCLTCVYFESFQACYGGPLDSSDKGFCECWKSPYSNNEVVGTGVVCDFHADEYIHIIDLGRTITKTAEELERFNEDSKRYEMSEGLMKYLKQISEPPPLTEDQRRVLEIGSAINTFGLMNDVNYIPDDYKMD